MENTVNVHACDYRIRHDPEPSSLDQSQYRYLEPQSGPSLDRGTIIDDVSQDEDELVNLQITTPVPMMQPECPAEIQHLVSNMFDEEDPFDRN